MTEQPSTQRRRRRILLNAGFGVVVALAALFLRAVLGDPQTLSSSVIFVVGIAAVGALAGSLPAGGWRRSTDRRSDHRD